MKCLVVFSLLFSVALAEEVCYEPCGCFNDDPPFDGRDLPNDIYGANEIFYTLFTPDDKTSGEPIFYDTDGFYIPSSFRADLKTTFLSHGWQNDPDSGGYYREGAVEIPSMRDIKDTILNFNDRNVILVDWSLGAGEINYFQSSGNTRAVGACNAVLAETLQDVGETHCAGHSLGGHVCGYQGDYHDGAMEWISGLDPAGPYFNVEDDPELRLDASDAQFVDVTHTSSGNLIPLGLYLPIGHADSYPHLGYNQPPCEDDNPTCDHGVCKAYYESSIAHEPQDCDFRAFPCDSVDDAENGVCNDCGGGCQSMGWWSHTNTNEQGTYYLEVDADYPFCQH